VTLGPVPGGSLNLSGQRVDASYASVIEQSGIFTGDGGFQLDVDGRTRLIGGAIASTDAAVDAGRNVLTTAGIVTEDLHNRADYQGRGFGLTAGFGTTEGDPDYRGSRMGVGSDSGSAESVTRAGVSGMAGHADIRTGDASGGLAPIVDVQQLEAELDARVAITGEFGQQATRLVGDIAQTKLEEALSKRLDAELALAAGDSERAAQLNAEVDRLQADWGDSGTLRLAAHTVIGALTGGTQGATGAAVGTLSAPVVANALKEAGIEGALAGAMVALVSTSAGAVTGGAAGGAAAYNEVLNNYLTTHAINEELERLAADDTGLDPELLQRLVAHQLLHGLQEHAPVDECSVIGTNCTPAVDRISAGLELLQEPSVREQLGDTLTDALIVRQLDDLHATLQAIDWSQDPNTLARAESLGRAARNFVEACAVVPVAAHCRMAALALTGADATEKFFDGDLTGALVQGGSSIVNPIAGGTISRNFEKTGVYSKEFLEWAKSIYGAGIEKTIQWTYDEARSNAGGE
jgi:hypothetical protein